jgi:Holliday junction resolvasome RuvABC ATP-dependent DNA helicase subunit
MDMPKAKIIPEVEKVTPEEEVLFTSLRANSWEDFHGQENIKNSLQIAIEAATKREEAIEHVLLYGPPGLGKTTLSHRPISESPLDRRLSAQVIWPQFSPIWKRGIFFL